MSIKLILTCFSFFFFSVGFGAEQTKTYLSMANEYRLPMQFRTTNDEFKINILVPPSRKGLEKLKVSGSRQFSEQGLKKILDTVPVEGKNVYILDLRRESHGFANGAGISFKSAAKGDYIFNLGLTIEEIERDELERLQAIQKEGFVIFSPSSNQMKVDQIESERALAKRFDVNYLRIPVLDNHRPSDVEVDQFLDFVRQLPDENWLHFHCAAGLGRTTSFMSMYDMMYNASEVEFNDIINRQNFIGGTDLFVLHENPLDPATSRKSNYIERLAFLEKFYLFCQKCDPFTESWSDWSPSN